MFRSNKKQEKVIRFKYRIFIDKKNGTQAYIQPKVSDFSYDNVDLSKYMLFEEGQTLEDFIGNKLKSFKGGSNNISKTAKNIKNIKYKSLSNNLI